MTAISHLAHAALRAVVSAGSGYVDGGGRLAIVKRHGPPPMDREFLSVHGAEDVWPIAVVEELVSAGLLERRKRRVFPTEAGRAAVEPERAP